MLSFKVPSAAKVTHETVTGPEVIKLFSCLVATKIYPAHNC